jgi:hypothetical protein
VLIVTGLHVPVTALFEVFGRDGGAEFWHNGPICVNVGLIFADTTISIVVVVAH